jgi:hypothetical protein
MSPESEKQNQRDEPMPKASGSGKDKNSDQKRLRDPENLLDKTVEDSFPASDPPSQTPVTGPAH